MMIAGCKHFPGDGMDDRNQHFCTTINSLSKEEWMATYGYVYKKMFGEEMKVSTVHAGLEGGMFTEKEPEMDIISIGPSCQYFHSPMERVSIRSVKKFYGFLTALLAKLK